jgi:hypothetical protein
MSQAAQQVDGLHVLRGNAKTFFGARVDFPSSISRKQVGESTAASVNRGEFPKRH